MEALLHGTPQFVVAAISFLISSNQALNLARIDDLFRRQVVRPTVRARVQWNLLVTGWWLLIATGLVAIVRIIASSMVSDSKTHPLFINLDIGIVSLMGLGASVLGHHRHSCLARTMAIGSLAAAATLRGAERLGQVSNSHAMREGLCKRCQQNGG